MPAPLSFYYVKKQENVSYTHRPQLILDFNRLINKLPAWKELKLGSDIQKKSLIFADWRMENFSSHKVRKIIQWLEELIKEGFSVYLWQDFTVIAPIVDAEELLEEEIKRLTLDNLSILTKHTIQQRITPQFKELIVKKALDYQGLTFDETLILDVQAVELHLNPQAKSYELRASEIRFCDLNRVRDALEESSLPFSIIYDNFPNLSAIKQISAAFPKWEKKEKYYNLTLDTITILETNTDEMETLCLNGRIGEGNNNYDYSKLARASHLKKFTIWADSRNQHEKIFNQLNGSSLEDVSIHTNRLAYLKILTDKSTKLRKISFALPQGLQENLDFSFKEALNLPYLEALTLSLAPLKTQELEYILKNTPNLTSLGLHHCHNLADSFTHLPIWNKLEALCIQYSGRSNALPLKNIIYLLEHAPNLKEIELEFCPPWEASVNLKLPNLKKLTLSRSSKGCPFTREELASLTQENNIRFLSLLGIFSPGFSRGIFAPQLEELNLQELFQQPLVDDDLLQFLTQLPELKILRLTLSLPSKLNFKAALQQVELKQLGVLFIKNAQSLNHLAHMPNLKHLSLDNGVFLDDFTKEYKLASLTHLELFQCTITGSQLKKLLRAAPNLKYFEMDPFNVKAIKDFDEELRKLISNIPQHKLEPSQEYAHLNPLTVKSTPLSLRGRSALDANTHFNPNKTFNVNKIFSPLTPATAERSIPSYRLEVFNELEIVQESCAIHQAFHLNRHEDKNLISASCQLLKNEESLETEGKILANAYPKDEFHLSRQALVLSGEWQALASLTVHDILTHYITTPPVELSISYSKRDNLYYVKGPIHIEVILTGLVRIPSYPVKVLTPAVTKLLNTIGAFKVGDLDMDLYPNPTGENYLSALIEQQKGSCRHRAAVFKALMERNPETAHIPVRIINNSCHAYVELQYDNQWISFDLGAYPAKLIVNESQSPGFNPQQQSAIVELPLTANPQPLAINPQYAAYFETWKKEQLPITNVLTYCQYLCQPGPIKKRLIELNSADEIEALQLSLQDYASKNSRPFFYIDSPDDLVCAASFIKREANKGTVQEGLGGPLFDFLQANENNNPLLIVNYSKFGNEVVRFNSFLDSDPSIDGVNLPLRTEIIGLTDVNHPDCYTGSDFYSRFDSVEQPSLTHQRLLEHREAIAPFFTQSQPNDRPTIVIDLYDASDWKEILFGHWEIQGDNLTFKPGELVEAIKENLPIEIHHAPLHNKEFQRFWRQARLRGMFPENIPFSDSISLVEEAPYSWETLAQALKIKDNHSFPAFILNPYTFSNLFTQFHFENEKLITEPGLLEEYQGKTLDIHLTRELSEEQWARCLATCQKHQVLLNVYSPPTINLPNVLAVERQAQSLTLEKPWENKAFLGDQIISSSDPTTTLSFLKDHQKDACIIDISEFEPEDILVSTQAIYKENKFHFCQQNKAVLNLLTKNKSVILTGKFSPALQDALASLLLTRETEKKTAGQLILLTETTCFPFLTHKHAVTKEEKIRALEKLFSPELVASLDEEKLLHESFSKISARLAYLEIYPTANSEDNWQGLKGIEGGVLVAPFDPEKDDAAAITEAVNQSRLAAVEQVLEKSPYVFITGLTGVGKSTFVESYLAEKNRVFFGENAMKAWACSASDKVNILFIDEANLSPRGWSEFQGLFHNPRGIVIDGRYYPLNANHKIIFAGNPLNYGDERHASPLFAEHGKAIIFNPLPPAYIFETLIKPILNAPPLAADAKILAKPWLDIYQFLCDNSRDKVLISPREIQMMALMLLSYQRMNPNLTTAEYLAASEHYAYQLSVKLVPKHLQATFQTQYQPSLKNIIKTPLPTLERVVLTKSRKALCRQLSELLTLQQLRQQKTDIQPKLDDAFLYGGLGGLVIEGEPGVGKSDFVRAILQSLEYKAVALLKLADENLPDKTYCYLPVNLELAQKKKLLLQAFHKGMIVVIEEINSSPLLERFLNDLLMGFTPDKKRATKAGFFVIGTQNPVSLAGRRRFSNALERRLITTTLPPYSFNELVTILTSKGLEKNKASELATVFIQKSMLAQQKNLKPAPTLRRLLKLTDKLLEKNAPEHYAAKSPVVTSTVRENPTSMNPATPSTGKRAQEKAVLEEEMPQYNASHLPEVPPIESKNYTPIETTTSTPKAAKVINTKQTTLDSNANYHFGLKFLLATSALIVTALLLMAIGLGLFAMPTALAAASIVISSIAVSLSYVIGALATTTGTVALGVTSSALAYKFFTSSSSVSPNSLASTNNRIK